MIRHVRPTAHRFAWARITSAARFIQIEGYLELLEGGPELHPHERVAIRVAAVVEDDPEPWRAVDHTVDQVLAPGSGLAPGDRAALRLWLSAVRDRLPVDLALAWLAGGAIESESVDVELWDSVLVTLTRTARTVRRALERVADEGGPPDHLTWDRWVWMS